METAVRDILQQFQDGYTQRDIENLDTFMQLFAPQDDIEMIGIGASVRDGYEWFQGSAAIREIIESDWTYWGEVTFDVSRAQITILDNIAWLSTAGTLTQTDTFDEALPFYLNQMKEMLEAEGEAPIDKMMEATHFGLRRLRDKQKGVGYKWALVLTAVLVRINDEWKFHTLHWSMPVD